MYMYIVHIHVAHTQKTEAWAQSIFNHFLLIAHERQNVDNVRIHNIKYIQH